MRGAPMPARRATSPRPPTSPRWAPRRDAPADRVSIATWLTDVASGWWTQHWHRPVRVNDRLRMCSCRFQFRRVRCEPHCRPSPDPVKDGCMSQQPASRRTALPGPSRFGGCYSPSRPPGGGGADPLPDRGLRLRRRKARCRPVRPEGAGQHLHLHHEPTNDVLEQRVAALEGGIAALALASGRRP